MHFWINKPAGIYGFSGRQYAATSVAKIRARQRHRSGELRQMVTPVHRFQSLSTTGNVAGPSNMNICRPFRPLIRTNNVNRNTSSINSIQHPQANNISNNVTNAGNNQLILSNTTTNGTNRSILDFSEFTDADLVGYRLRCGIWIISILITGFVAAAKFYFGYEGPGFEILVFCGFLTLILLAFLCFILCRRTHTNNHQEHRVQEDQTTSLTNTNTYADENIRSIPIVRQNPPPPYHIAILIPPPDTSDEAPPPSYDKVIR